MRTPCPKRRSLQLYRAGRGKALQRVSIWLAGITALSACAQESEGPKSRNSVRPDYAACLNLTDEIVFDGPLVGYTWILATTGETTYIRPLFAPYQIGVFERSGNERLLGGEGEGPGEFRHIKAMVPLENGSLYVLDVRNRRLSHIDPDGGVLGTTTIPILAEDNGLHILPDSTVLIAGRQPTREFYGYPFFRIGRDGRVLATFSGPSPMPGGGEGYRPVATAVDMRGGIWSTPLDRVRLTEWSIEGDSVRTIAGERPWLEQVSAPRSPPAGPEVDESMLGLPPQSRIVGLSPVGRAGHLLLLGHTADPDWEEAEPPSKSGRWADYYDSVLEVWDVESGEMVCTERFDEYFVRAVSGFVFGFSQDRLGSPMIYRWRLSETDTAP